MRNKSVFAGASVQPADPEQVLEFLRGLKKTGQTQDIALTEDLVRQYVSQFPLGQLQSIARRIMMDIMKGPQRDLLRLAEEEPVEERTVQAKAKRAATTSGDKRGSATKRRRRTRRPRKT